MRVVAPYRCDYCLNLKGEANHWWLRNVTTLPFILSGWDEELAASGKYEHICSESCALKALAKWMGAK